MVCLVVCCAEVELKIGRLAEIVFLRVLLSLHGLILINFNNSAQVCIVRLKFAFFAYRENLKFILLF